MPVELSLGCRYSQREIVVNEGRIDDFVAVVLQAGRLDAARHRIPAVEEKDFRHVSPRLSPDQCFSPEFAVRLIGKYSKSW